MEIHFVTGKGGVGKTTVAGLLGLGFAAKGRSTLVAELGDSSALQILWDLPEISYSPRRVQRGLDLSRWSGSDCLREYLQHLIKLETLTSLFFDNKVTRSLVNVAPALHELAILGKATSGPPRFVGPPMPYEVLVIDAYASGHFLNLLRAPQAMADAIPFGPMGVQSRSIDKVLRSEICQVHLVTLPEALPTSETLELARDLDKEFKIRPHLVINKVKWPQPLPQPSPGRQFLQQAARLRELETQQLAKLVSANWRSTQKLPMVWSSNARVIFDQLAPLSGGWMS